MEIRQSPALGVSHLPTSSFGVREPLWWGIMLAIAIETTGFALVWSTYLYLRMQEATWPPWRWGAPDVLIGMYATVAILASAVPMLAIQKGAYAMDLPRVRRMLVIFFAVSFVCCGIRYWEFIGLQVKWDSNAYGSTVWAMLVLHTTHLITSILETGILAAYLFMRPLDPKHALDL